VVHPALKRAADGLRDAEARLEEAVGLAEAIDLRVGAAEVIRIDQPRPKSYIGEGALERLAEQVKAAGAEVAVFDTQLSPVQQRNLEKALNCKVIDRTGLILEIFGERARTREGQLQVELAALSYQRSRLVRSWTHLERQRGGAGFMGGPGERQIELDRRIIDDRIVRLKRELDQVKRTRELHRSARKRVPFPVVALVGYTNAGKSTLFNRLTRAEVLAEDMLFATLDPTMRRVRVPTGEVVILSDTVGFITDLPHDLVAAFRATLEEVLAADLILHVRDVAHPETEAQKAGVEAVLAELGIDLESVEDRRVIEVCNKIDLLPAEERGEVVESCRMQPDRVAISAVSGEGVDTLLQAVADALGRRQQPVELAIDLTDGATLAWIYQHGRVLERHDDEREAHLRVALDPAQRARLDRRLQDQEGGAG